MANLIDKKDLKKVFWRSQICQFSHNYERMQSFIKINQKKKELML